MRHTALAAALVTSLVLAACGGEPEAPAAANNAATADAATADAIAASEEAPAELPPLPTGDFRIASITLGKAVDEEGQVRAPLDAFAPGDKIHAAVVSVGSSEGLTLSARWLGPDGSVIASAGQSLEPTAPTVTTFSIAQPEPWPAGSYQVEIAVNGRSAETRGFEVR